MSIWSVAAESAVDLRPTIFPPVAVTRDKEPSYAATMLGSPSTTVSSPVFARQAANRDTAAQVAGFLSAAARAAQGPPTSRQVVEVVAATCPLWRLSSEASVSSAPAGCGGFGATRRLLSGARIAAWGTFLVVAAVVWVATPVVQHLQAQVRLGNLGSAASAGGIIARLVLVAILVAAAAACGLADGALLGIVGALGFLPREADPAAACGANRVPRAELASQACFGSVANGAAEGFVTIPNLVTGTLATTAATAATAAVFATVAAATTVLATATTTATIPRPLPRAASRDPP